MPVITPRRRFLITAPLALLLPAGLLTYLGFETVKGVDIQYELIAQEKVTSITKSIRDRTSNRVIYTIQYPFKDIFEREGPQQITTLPPLPDFSFDLTDDVPAAHSIFLYGSDQNLYFFHRKTFPASDDDEETTEKKKNSCWTIESPSRNVFAGRLKSHIETNLESMRDAIHPVDAKTFHTLYYPINDLYPIDGKRMLAFYKIFSDLSHAGADSPILAYGMTIDFDYINNHFFQILLDEMWPELQHPVSIEDVLQGKRVAVIKRPNEGRLEESTKYRPEIFQNEFFPWYRVHFSAAIGEEVMQYANNLKIFYYCLIATANLIMIASLIGALRNISKELALSDMRSNFVARVSHELRTPLGLIRLYSETLEMNRAKTEEKRIAYLHAITKESERLTHMINNILNFSRMEANSLQYSMAPNSIEPIILETIDSLQYHFERHGLQINIQMDQDLPSILCDPDALQQALYNLLNNAMKYSGDGKNVDVQVYRDDGEVVLSVTDYGIGIASDQHEKIFDEFYRVNDPQVRETGGSGLGLAVVKHIVKAHRGRLTVASKPKEGSTFAIHIPIDNELQIYEDNSRS
ncbi:MAG: hypothetical protein JXR73_21085 [Candidatus Omnitrophica bacterium]|nr:hypothetical protein [Candidatus Omnitrophota bacterium]